MTDSTQKAGEPMPLRQIGYRTIGFLEGLADDLDCLASERASRCRGFAQALRATLEKHLEEYKL